MASQARVVVIGGGCVGAGVLYGLARRGWSDCVLLERSRFAGASTRLAGGVIPTYVRSDAASRMINRTLAIYQGLEAETGLSAGWHPCGQMRLARSRDRLDEYRSYMNVAEAIGANARLLEPHEVRARWPLYRDTEGILGALFHPDDGYVGPTDVTMSMLKGARDRGARAIENARVTGITRLPSGDWRVEFDEDSIRCEHVVLATGAFARQTGAMLGLDIPALPVVVQYWFTGPVPEVIERRRRGLPEFPITRDDHFLGYMREEGDGLLWGTYERSETLPVFALDRVPDSYDGDPLPEDLDADLWGLERAAELMPSFAEAGLRSNLRGPMQMTADGMPLVGPAWGLRNVWLAEGVPGGILWGGAIGHYLSEWIVDGGTSIDMNEIDARRFGPFATRDWVRERAREVWGMHSDVILPGQEMTAARPARTTPADDLLGARGAVWGAAGGWEVANWYAPAGVAREDVLSYRDSPNARWVGEEALAVRHGVGLIDSSWTTRLEISGPGAADFLDAVLATPLPRPGTVGAGYLLFENGGVRAGFAVYRLDETRFELGCGPSSERLYADELWRRLPQDGSVALRPVTMQYGCFELAGPRARDVLADLVEIDLSTEQFPPGAIRSAALGLAHDVRLVRTGSTGELGWELVHPIAYQRTLLERILAVGATHGLRLIGQRALKPLRLEKSYPAVGPDMNVEISAIEAGIAGSLDLRKGVFPGRASVLRPAARAPARVLATLSITSDGASVLGHESVRHEGRTVGRVTSGAYSPYFRHDIALALLPAALSVPGTPLQVPILDRLCPAQVVAPSPYDPENLRLLA
jgi:dimethylglycine dehydrogenase